MCNPRRRETQLGPGEDAEDHAKCERIISVLSQRPSKQNSQSSEEAAAGMNR